MSGESRRSRLQLVAKLIISGSLLLLLLGSIDHTKVVAALAALPLWAVLLGLGVLAIQAIVLAWRWHRVTAWIGGSLPFPSAARLTLVGLFFNQTMPTSIGGDVMRVWGAYRLGMPTDLALSSVLIERTTGLVSVALMVAFSLPLVWSELAQSSLRWVLLSTAPLAIGGLAVLTISDSLLVRWLPSTASAYLRSLAAGLRRIAASPPAFGELMALGGLSAMIGITETYVVGSQIGIPLGFAAYLVVVGGATLLTVLPISIAGWGVREMTVVGLFGTMGVPAEKALIVSVLFGLGLSMVALPGGVLWLFGEYRIRSQN